MKRLLLVVVFAGLGFLSLRNLLNVTTPQFILGVNVDDAGIIQVWYGCHFIAYMLAILVLIADFSVLNGMCYGIFVFHFVELGALYLVLSEQSAQLFLSQFGAHFRAEILQGDPVTVVTMIIALAAVANAAMLYFFYAIENNLN